MDWLIREKVILEHKAGTPLEAVNPRTIDSETFDLTEVIERGSPCL